MRRKEFDILKGILMILVVIGHTNLNFQYVDIYWFHMPIFFMVTGYLTKRWLSIQDIITPSNEDSTFKCKYSPNKKVNRLLLPYFAYCIILYMIFQPEPIIKNIVRVFCAGSMNTTLYSYPFWFINALLVSNIMYGTIKKSKYAIYILLAIWIFIHLNIKKHIPIPIRIPWGIDNSLGVVVFLYIGDMAKRYEFKKWHLIFLFVAPLFTICNEYFGLEYRLNMKSLIYNSVILDLIVPISFGFGLYILSLFIAKVPHMSKILSYFGVCSITIFYLHASFLHVFKPHLNATTNVALTLAMCMLIHYLLNKSTVTRKLFLGKEN